MDNSINNVVWEVDQILSMPDEVFIHIFSFVPIARRQNTVGLVCQRFYDLLCDLEQDMHPLELNYQQIYDDEIFDSIISSGRRFNDLTIDLKTCPVLESLERVEAVAQKFGPRIVKFKLYSSVRKMAQISESQLITIFNGLPKVQEITLRNICVRQSFNIDVEDLKLHELTKLAIDECIFKTPAILNKIPADVLQELVFTFIPYDVTRFQRFMNQQSRIRKLEMFENDEITFDHLQLEHLKISSSTDFVAMINQQPKLRYLDFTKTWIDDSVFRALCNLKYLEVLKILIDGVSISEFENVKNLTRLKELRLDSHECYGCDHLLELCMMKCLPIEKLTLLYYDNKIPEVFLIQMSLNYRRLKKFEIINNSIKVITTILQHFPSLESMLLDFFGICSFSPEDVLVINDDFQRHENLKQLIVTYIRYEQVENSSALLKLLNACPNLERIMLSELSGINSDDLKHIIESHPHLTHLSLDFDDFEFNEEIINFLINFPHKLVYLQLRGLSSIPTYSTLFDEVFPNISFRNKFEELIMKKRNVTNWDFKL